MLSEIKRSYAGFDSVTDPDLIDCYIYEVNSVLKRYKFLLEQAAKINLLPEEELNPELSQDNPKISSFSKYRHECRKYSCNIKNAYIDLCHTA